MILFLGTTPFCGGRGRGRTNINRKIEQNTYLSGINKGPTGFVIKDKLQIRNSTAEFLIFQLNSKADGVEVMYRDETLWLTQDSIAVLFDKSRSTITEHLQNIFQSQELQEDTVCRKFRRTAADGKDYTTI